MSIRVPSSDEAREYGKKGGIASGKKRNEKKMFREAVIKALTAKEDGTTILDKGVLALCKRMMEGDPKAFEILRDTAGEKPTEKLNATVESENTRIMKDYLEALKKE